MIAPRHQIAHRNQGTRGFVGILPLCALLKIRRQRDAKVVTRIAGLNRQADGGSPLHRGVVGILACLSQRLGCARHCRSCAQHVARAGDRLALIIGHGDAGQLHIASVGHQVGPGNRLARQDVEPRCFVGILPIGQLGELNGRRTAKVVAGIRVRDLHRLQAARDGNTGHRRHVAVLSRHRGVGYKALHRVRLTKSVLRAGHLSQLAVENRDRRDLHIAQIGDDVLPGDFIAYRNKGTRARICLYPVRQLLDTDSRLSAPAQIVAGIAVRDIGAARWRAHHCTHVGVGIGYCCSGHFAGHRHRRCQAQRRTFHQAELVVRYRDFGQRDVAGVGHDIGPGHNFTSIDVGPWFGVGIPAIGVFVDLDRGRDTEVVALITGRNRRTQRRRSGHLTSVGVLAQFGGPGCRAGHGLVWRQGRTRTFDVT